MIKSWVFELFVPPAELAQRVKVDVQPGKTPEQVIEEALSELAQNALIMS